MKAYELENIKNKISNNIDNIILDLPLETRDKIMQLKEQIIQDIQEQQQIIILPQLIAQQFLFHFGGFLYTPDERKQYYLFMAIKSIYKLPEIQQKLKNEYGDRYEYKMAKFNEYFKIVTQIKNYKDIIEQDEKIRTNINHPIIKETNRLCKQIPLIFNTPFEILWKIIENTNIGMRSVPNDVQRIYQMAYKKIRYDLKKEPKPLTPKTIIKYEQN